VVLSGTIKKMKCAQAEPPRVEAIAPRLQ
jgi:hypothetical protein